jgi:hypothetical protein
MKRMLAVALVSLVGFCGSLRAAPLDPSTISADAKWFVHVDIDAVRQSKVVQHIKEEALKHDQVKKMLDKVTEMTGMDPQKDLHGVTVYGTKFEPHSGVLIVYAHADHKKIMDLIERHKDLETKKDGDTEMYRWTEHHGDHEHEVFVAFPKEGVAVAAGSEDELKSALAVLGGKNGLSNGSALLGEVPKGATALIGISSLADVKVPKQAEVVKKITAIHIATGELDGQDFDHIRVSTADEETAKQFKALVEGFKAMAGMHVSDKPDLKKLVDGLKVDSSDKTLSIDWSGSSADIIKMCDKMHEMMEAHMHGKAHDEKK